MYLYIVYLYIFYYNNNNKEKLKVYLQKLCMYLQKKKCANLHMRMHILICIYKHVHMTNYTQLYTLMNKYICMYRQCVLK